MNVTAHTIRPDQSANEEYRYKKFTSCLLFRDLRFQKETAKAGDLLPSFKLITANGNQTTIMDLASGKPILLIFGSLTCPMTASAIPALNELHRKFGEHVEFVIINVREAHPGEFFPQPETAEKKQDHARALARHYALPWTVVSDDIDGHLHRYLDPKPNSAFIIDADGIIVFRSLWASAQRALHQALESVANGEKLARSECTALLGPVIRAIGYVHEVMERAGPQAAKDLWWGAFPVALAGRLATVFSTPSPSQRGIYAVLTLALSGIIIMASIIMWLSVANS